MLGVNICKHKTHTYTHTHTHIHTHTNLLKKGGNQDGERYILPGFTAHFKRIQSNV